MTTSAPEASPASPGGDAPRRRGPLHWIEAARPAYAAYQDAEGALRAACEAEEATGQPPSSGTYLDRDEAAVRLVEDLAHLFDQGNIDSVPDLLHPDVAFCPARSDDQRPAVRVGAVLVFAYPDADGRVRVTVDTEDINVEDGAPPVITVNVNNVTVWTGPGQ